MSRSRITPTPTRLWRDSVTPANPFYDATVAEIYSGAVSNDNQLTASYQRRLTYGFTVQASYTWAHALDEISSVAFCRITPQPVRNIS